MPLYAYKAVDHDGRWAKGRLEAFNDSDLELRLARSGLDLISFSTAGSGSVFLRLHRAGLKDLITFCFQLEQSVSAGVPLLDALADVRDSTENQAFKRIIGAMLAEVEGGRLLSQALAAYPQVFNSVFVSLVKAGEQTGKLPEVFGHLAATLQWQDELQTQTRRMMTYPLLVFLALAAVVAFLMMYLVPQLVPFLQGLGQALPLETRMLILISETLVDEGWLILALLLLISASLPQLLKRSARMRYRCDGLKLRLPLIGELIKKIILARFSRYFAMMYQTGIPILDALNSCEDIVANRVVAEALARVRQQIEAGDSMSESFRNNGLFPPLVVRMINVGESTGALDKSLNKISYFYDRDVTEGMQTMLKLIEPALTVMLGVILAFIMVAVLGPLYGAFAQMKL